jgi:hypothetical protein
MKRRIIRLRKRIGKWIVNAAIPSGAVRLPANPRRKGH